MNSSYKSLQIKFKDLPHAQICMVLFMDHILALSDILGQCSSAADADRCT